LFCIERIDVKIHFDGQPIGSGVCARRAHFAEVMVLCAAFPPYN